MTADIEKIVEIGARAACKARKIDPDYCTLGGGFIRSDGTGDSYCSRRAWQDAAMELYPAILGILAAGLAIVPREATDAMCDKGENAIVLGPLPADLDTSPSASWAAAKAIYRAMVEAFSPVKGSEESA